jgi:hypothetical protein
MLLMVCLVAPLLGSCNKKTNNSGVDAGQKIVHLDPSWTPHYSALISYFNFDGPIEVVPDGSTIAAVVGPNGSVNNASSFITRASDGLVQSLHLDGDDATAGVRCISFPAATSISLGSALNPNWTIALWVNPGEYLSATWPVFYSYGSWVASLGLTSQGGGGPLEVWINNTTSYVSNGIVPLHAWSYVAVTYTPTLLTLYINGVESGTVANPAAIATVSDGSFIGSIGQGSSNATVQSKIDELSVFKVALSAADLLTIYNHQTSSF